MKHPLPRSIILLWLLTSFSLQADPWRCYIIDPDPKNHGPDGVTVGDFDEDGHPDLLVPFEQGNYSRVYFHPGFQEATHQSRWTWIEFPLGGEDNGAGDLDQDGHIDLVINGGHILFNPGPDQARNPKAWQKMTLFTRQARVPIVRDIDGDSHPDLLVDGTRLYPGPKEDKRNAAHWRPHTLGKTTWAMNALFHDMNRDGLVDILVADRRGQGTVWFEAPSGNRLTAWNAHIIDPRTRISFMKLGDVDQDGLMDLILTHFDTRSLSVLRRTDRGSQPQFKEHSIPQASGDFPKGVNHFDYDGDGRPEIFVLPKGKGEWMAEVEVQNGEMRFETRPLMINGAQERLKMDDAVHADIDGDGDIDIVSTDENGGWGVIWFENPRKKPPHPKSLPHPFDPNQSMALLHQEDFNNDDSAWAIEQMDGGTTVVHHGIMEIDDAKGCTIWFRERLEAPLLIEFDVQMIQEGGPHDRTSDLNSFTMAIDPERPNDLLAGGAQRGGSFKNYHGLRLYYVGYGANKNRTARFRRYVGDGTRPVLPEHDLERSHLPNQWRRVQIISTHGSYQYRIDDELVFNIHDPEPYTSGWFGFRTVRNHMAIDRFRVWRLGESSD